MRRSLAAVVGAVVCLGIITLPAAQPSGESVRQTPPAAKWVIAGQRAAAPSKWVIVGLGSAAPAKWIIAG